MSTCESGSNASEDKTQSFTCGSSKENEKMRPVPAPRRQFSSTKQDSPVPAPRLSRRGKDTARNNKVQDDPNYSGSHNENAKFDDEKYLEVVDEESSSSNEEYDDISIEKTSCYDDCMYEDLDYDTDEDLYDELHNLDLHGQQHQELRLVMVGKTGAGKSSTANLLIPGNKFVAMASGQSVTKQCQRGTIRRDGFRIMIIDTPGLFDTQLSENEIRENIIDCIQKTLPGPHLFLIIIQIGRFTNEEIEALDNLFHIFGNSMEFHSILIFTRYDDLQRDGINIATYIERGGKQLQSYVKKCNNRFFAVNNFVKGPKKEEMVRDFIATLSQISRENQWKPYTHEMIEEAQKNVQPLLEKVLKEKDTLNRSEVERMECHYESMTQNVQENRNKLMAKIRRCNEERDILLEKKRERLTNSRGNSASALSEGMDEQTELDDLEQKLKMTYNELEHLKGKQREIECEYAEIKRRKKKKVRHLKKHQHAMLMSELQNVKDEHFKQIELLIKTISILDQQIDGVNRELEAGPSKSDKKKLTLRKNELMKEKQKAGQENVLYIERMLEKSNNLQKQLAKKEKFCGIM